MDGLTALTALGIAFTLYLAITTIQVKRRLLFIRREIHKDRVRNSWANARVLTYQLAREGKLSVHSATFSEFVRVQTFVLRRPDEYRAISNLLLNELLLPTAGEPRWLSEAPDWPDEMRLVVDYMAHGTYDLLRSRRRGRLLLYLVDLAPHKL